MSIALQLKPTATTPIRSSEIELRSVSMRILIIDDSVVMRKIVESAPRHAGLELAQVLHACDGLEGLAVLERAAERDESFDLILCDVHMPVMDGVGFPIEKPRLNLAQVCPS